MLDLKEPLEYARHIEGLQLTSLLTLPQLQKSIELIEVTIPPSLISNFLIEWNYSRNYTQP
jgi:hypothetical protein